ALKEPPRESGSLAFVRTSRAYAANAVSTRNAVASEPFATLTPASVTVDPMSRAPSVAMPPTQRSERAQSAPARRTLFLVAFAIGSAALAAVVGVFVLAQGAKRMGNEVGVRTDASPAQVSAPPVSSDTLPPIVTPAQVVEPSGSVTSGAASVPPNATPASSG